MWLVNFNTLKLENFISSEVPEYAILSHTWEEDEVKFQELDRLSPGSSPTMLVRQDIYDTTPKGYHKIYETCLLALERGLGYAWIDTCCINKESSAELTESINSMFTWYQNAVECYAFLSDLPSEASAWDGLRSCRWFTRGWTLQELIAPADVLFYDSTWTYIGTRKDFLYRISNITNIKEDALLGVSPETFSIATRMSWAANRKTTRIEDLAYCLLEIFQVNMPMIYGEGANAFLRLQEEIIKRSNDLTIFAWYKGPDEPFYAGALALSPAAFKKSKNIVSVSRAVLDPGFAMTNKGLRFDNFKMLFKKAVSYSTYKPEYYIIPLGCFGASNDWVAMRLRKIGPSLFVRYGDLVPNVRNNSGREAVSFYLHANIWTPRDDEAFRQREIICFAGDNFDVEKLVPESHWDHRNHLFFAPSEDSSVVLAVDGTIQAIEQIRIIVCLEYRETSQRCIIFNKENHRPLWLWLFHQQRSGYDATWDDLTIAHPEITQFDNSMKVHMGGTTFAVTASMYSKQTLPAQPPKNSLDLKGVSIYFHVVPAILPQAPIFPQASIELTNSLPLEPEGNGYHLRDILENFDT